MFKRAIVATATAAALLTSVHAHALLDAETITDDMSSDEEAAYILGAADMYMLSNTYYAECIIEWLDDGDGYDEIHDIMEEFPDKPASAIVVTMIERQCVYGE